MSPSGDLVPPNNTGVITQIIKVANPQNANLRMRYKLSYTVNGAAINDQGEVSGFPPNLFT